MEGEVTNIKDDREALRWALGCVTMSAAQRIAAFDVLEIFGVRRMLAVFIVFQAMSVFFFVSFTFAYWSKDLGIAQWLAQGTEGDDYHRFIPLMDAMPWWLMVLGCIIAMSYLASAYQLLSRKPSSATFLMIGTVLNSLAWLYQASLPGYAQAFSAGHLRSDCLIFILQGLIAILLWQHKMTTQPASLSPSKHSKFRPFWFVAGILIFAWLCITLA